ncbi:hypothetical protein ABTW96_32800 [Nocardia beijingensis]|uniref:hypothetical protein n=1 Tax=Nocardia beijingensis TaxID=95162 RepID=UPI003332FEB6
MEAQRILDIAEPVTTPSFTDVSIATNTIIDSVGEEGVVLTVTAGVAAVCEVMGVQALADGRIEVGNVDIEDVAEQVRAAPVLQYVRVVHATRLAIARLVAQGLIVPASWGGDTEVTRTVPYTVRGYGSAIHIPVGAVMVPGSFRVTPGLTAIGDVALLTVSRWTDVMPLLNERLLRLLEECLDAARRGSYLSAVTVLGALLEGAWWAVAEKLRKVDKPLEALLAGTRAPSAAVMQGKVTDVLRAAKLPAGAASADSLLAFAGHVRQVRNYGIHSTIKDDLAAEKFFTETGSYLLILQAHSHLVQLLGAARKIRPGTFRS